MKVLFLDIDGVVNCKETAQRHRGIIGIDPYLAFLVGKITLAVPDLKVVLSSSWRHMKDGIEEVSKQVAPIFDVTPTLPYPNRLRGDEINEWLKEHPDVDQYAILDDDSDFHPDQPLFKTTWDAGITEEIVQEIINHFQTNEKIR